MAQVKSARALSLVSSVILITAITKALERGRSWISELLRSGLGEGSECERGKQ